MHHYDSKSIFKNTETNSPKFYNQVLGVKLADDVIFSWANPNFGG